MLKLKHEPTTNFGKNVKRATQPELCKDCQKAGMRRDLSPLKAQVKTRHEKLSYITIKHNRAIRNYLTSW